MPDSIVKLSVCFMCEIPFPPNNFWAASDVQHNMKSDPIGHILNGVASIFITVWGMETWAHDFTFSACVPLCKGI